MKGSTKAAIVAVLTGLYSAGGSALFYLQGIKDQGGTLADWEGISILIIALTSIGAGISAILTLLAKPPKDGLLVKPEPEIQPVEIDLTPAKK